MEEVPVSQVLLKGLPLKTVRRNFSTDPSEP